MGTGYKPLIHACGTPFKHFNAWVPEDGFFHIVREAWNITVIGTPMYIVVKKLSNVKKALRSWNKGKGAIPDRILKARSYLNSIQSNLCSDPANTNMQRAEKIAKDTYSHKLSRS